MNKTSLPPVNASNFITDIIDEDIKHAKQGGRVATRFPPEPNGYLHIGHAKAICVSFGIAQKYGGTCNLRFDDTNPVNEDIEFMNSIIEDVKWLGFSWGERLFNASDYFDKIYDFAVHLIKSGKAYVDDLTPDQIREYRGTLTEPGKESPFRRRSVDENLHLFQRMKGGEFPDGSRVLRAKIDMSSPNINMRDPILYRIKHEHHHKTGAKWAIYPMYDYAHVISDAIEGITFSLCTLEFEDHRPLYDWCLDNLPPFKFRPRQIEFARLNINYTVMSKRKLKQLVNDGHVSGWDDPRMPTLAGLRRRGVRPEALRNFVERIGLSKADGIVEMGLLDFCIRDDLEKSAPRGMAVLRPLKVVIESYPQGKIEEIESGLHPQHPEMGTRKLIMEREIYIEEDDFMEDPPKDFFRLGPGKEVRLRHSYIIKCETVIKDASGKVVELRCSHDPSTLGKNPEGRKVKGIVHWVPVNSAVKAEARLYDRLFNAANPNDVAPGKEFTDHLNPKSLEVISNCWLEPALGKMKPGDQYQFERVGYFCADTKDTKDGKIVVNRTVALRDSYTAAPAK